MPRDINLIGGFYEAKSLPFSAQDTVNWLPVPSQVQGSRSPIKLRGLPGLVDLGGEVTPLPPQYNDVSLSTFYTADSVSSFTVDPPEGTIAGDIMIAFCSSSTSFGESNMKYYPTGVSRIFEESGSATGADVYSLCAFIATAGMATSGIDFSGVGATGAGVSAAACHLYRIPASIAESPVSVDSQFGLPFSPPIQVAPYPYSYPYGAQPFVFCAISSQATSAVSTYPLNTLTANQTNSTARLASCYGRVDAGAFISLDQWGMSPVPVAPGVFAVTVRPA